MYKIVEKRVLSPQVCLFKIDAPQIAKKRKPGQFIMLRVEENGERIPLTIAGSDPKNGTVTIISQAIGKTTKILNSLKEGESLVDFVGPLGVPTHLENFGTAVVIGGGVGTAEALPLAQGLKEAGNKVINIMGFRNKDLVFMEKEFGQCSDKLYISTDDGSYGHKGFVTDVLKKILDEGTKVDFVLAIGPVMMMKAVADMTREKKIKTMVSLNTIMLDGTGMCGACRCTVGGKRKFACVDGPEFDGHEVDFDELIKRGSIFKKQEMISDENCKIDAKS